MVLRTSVETADDNAWGFSASHFSQDETCPSQMAGCEGGEANGTWRREQFITPLLMRKLRQQLPSEQNQNLVFSHLSPEKQNAFALPW